LVDDRWVMRSGRTERSCSFVSWFRNVWRNLMASTSRKTFGLASGFCRSGKTFWPKNWTTSTRTLVEVTPCWTVAPREAIEVSR